MLVDLTVETRLKYQKTLAPIPSMNPVDENDLALVSRMAAGEDAAMPELVAAYGQRLYAYALRLTADPAQAEDVVQDALLVAWKTAGSFRGQGRLIAWLLGIVHHIAVKSLRRRSEPITSEMEENLPAGSPSPEQQVEQAEQAHRLRGGLDALSPEHREALELVFYQGLSLAEVARVCRVPVGTVKSRLSYAREQLRGLLTRQGLERVR